ncbi:type II secretion system protein N [Kordiimonas pumila]|uniref:Type II secretion system protein N n=1 Tax=Kordiimonas pumila TaxID=2161677 RepID=A0ABV7D7F5_9PROT|nr:type II secretion system protein N [Kordiimonas pumila]
MMRSLPLKNWFLVLLGFVAFVFFVVLQAPASFVFSNISQVSGTFEGTLWQARARALTVNGIMLENVTLETGFWPLLAGDLVTRATVNGRDVRGMATFVSSGGTYSVNELQGQFSKAIGLYGVRFLPTTHIQATTLVFSDTGECMSGSFQLETTFLQDMLRQLGGDAPVLSGMGVCTDMGIKLDLAGSDDGMRVEIPVSVNQQGMASADITVIPVISADEGMRAVAGVAGLQYDGTAYKGTLQFSLKP